MAVLSGMEKGAAVAPTVQPYTKAERRTVLISCALGYWLDFYNLVIVAFLMNAIEKSLSITLTEAGVITSLTLAGSVVGGILFGWIGDRIGRKNSLLLTLLIFSLGSIVSAFAWGYLSLLAFRFIAGVGLGGEWGAGMVLLNEIWNRKQRAFGSAAVQGMAGLGVAAAAVVAVWALHSFGPDWGWRIALLTGGAPIFLTVYVRFWMPESRLWLEYIRLREAGQLPPEKASEKSSLIEIFRGASRRYLILAIIAWGFYVTGYQSITVFMPTLITRVLGASLDVVRSITVIYGFVNFAVMLVVGWYGDRIGRRLGVVLPTCVAIAAYFGIYWSGGTHYPGSIWQWPLFYFYILWAAGQTAISQFGPWFSELFPVEIRSSAVSTIYTLGRTIGSAAPFIVPALAASFGGNVLLGMMFGLLGSLVCLTTVLFLPETAGRAFIVIEGKER